MLNRDHWQTPCKKLVPNQQKLAALIFVYLFHVLHLVGSHLPNLHLMVERSHSTSRLLCTTASKHCALSTFKHWRARPAFEKFSPMLFKGFCLNSVDSWTMKSKIYQSHYIMQFYQSTYLSSSEEKRIKVTQSQIKKNSPPSLNPQAKFQYTWNITNRISRSKFHYSTCKRTDWIYLLSTVIDGE